MKWVRVGFVLVMYAALAYAAKPGDFLTQGPRNANRIALTFDDGPGPQTEQFLELLARYNVKGTFFMLGEMAELRPVVAKKVADQGHEIASHTYSHANYVHVRKSFLTKFGDTEDGGRKADTAAREQLIAEMKKTRTILEKTTGTHLVYCRMPHGVDRPWVKEAAKETGFVLVNWTYGSDWTTDPKEKLEPGYVSAIQPGAILLLHDGNPHREKSLALTEAVIKAAKEKGFEMVTVGELLK